MYKYIFNQRFQFIRQLPSDKQDSFCNLIADAFEFGLDRNQCPYLLPIYPSDIYYDTGMKVYVFKARERGRTLYIPCLDYLQYKLKQ